MHKNLRCAHNRFRARSREPTIRLQRRRRGCIQHVSKCNCARTRRGLRRFEGKLSVAVSSQLARRRGPSNSSSLHTSFLDKLYKATAARNLLCAQRTFQNRPFSGSFSESDNSFATASPRQYSACLKVQLRTEENGIAVDRAEGPPRGSEPTSPPTLWNYSRA